MPCSIPSRSSSPKAGASNSAVSGRFQRGSGMRASAAIHAPAMPVEVDAKRVPYFKPGKEMRERLNLSEVTAE